MSSKNNGTVNCTKKKKKGEKKGKTKESCIEKIRIAAARWIQLYQEPLVKLEWTKVVTFKEMIRGIALCLASVQEGENLKRRNTRRSDDYETMGDTPEERAMRFGELIQSMTFYQQNPEKSRSGEFAFADIIEHMQYLKEEGIDIVKYGASILNRDDVDTSDTQTIMELTARWIPRAREDFYKQRIPAFAELLQRWTGIRKDMIPDSLDGAMEEACSLADFVKDYTFTLYSRDDQTRLGFLLLLLLNEDRRLFRYFKNTCKDEYQDWKDKHPIYPELEKDPLMRTIQTHMIKKFLVNMSAMELALWCHSLNFNMGGTSSRNDKSEKEEEEDRDVEDQGHLQEDKDIWTNSNTK
jgi:hypothetical protein